MNTTLVRRTLAKVPEVTLVFWLIKIAATTLGETGGDAVTMSWLGETSPGANGMGYLIGTAIFAVVFLAAVALQIRRSTFNPWVYWFAIIASTTIGTTLADFVTRAMGVGYSGGSAMLLLLVFASLFAWKKATGTVAVDSVGDAKSEAFYWLTITCSQTLGTALGDWVADTAGLGYTGGMLIFGGLLLVVAGLYFSRKVSPTALFWAAFILTRPLGAVLGDFLDKPVVKGGLALSRYSASAVLLVFIAACIIFFPQRAARARH
ncbi:COG4705 family protein [Lysobacter soyae]|uniref:COG4705 family protein n=1 Tax=Lysobacter soyae TaxID=2764185 RepID=UPI002106D10E|nr:hypothetical protein [Lysobacter sp. CJ11]